MTAPGKERVGDYELLDLIGDGSQGRVYKARYCGEDASRLAQEEIVAAKLIRITGDDDKLRTKFQAQADILRRLSHNNIVRYRDSFAWHAGEWDEAQCLVMEFLEGEPLSDRLKKANTGLPWSQVEGIFEQCLAGLIHARERGITHRDIKPSNLFITTEGQAKVIDFDIARRDDSGQMSTAGWKGTFDYMAPDFITIPGFRGDELSDIFSLGVCFYQALTGVLPYESLGDSAHIGYLNRWRDGAAPSPSFRPGVFRVLSNAKPFVAKCLAAKREQRYQTFATMLEDFRKIRARRIRHKNKEEYELLAVLGRGGFGEVFKARKISDGSLVAVKHLFAEKQSERFIKEAKILQQYPHPNLCKYVDFMVVEGTAGEKQYFLILEFLEGMPGWTLRTRLKNEGRLEAAEAMPLFVGYLSALQFLHENSRPIIHRDIKPGNLYAPVGQPENGKIFDLGVARDVSGTVTVGGIPGTLDYMPPEFAEVGGDRGSPQSDIYALGLCLYESLAGRPVHERLPTDLNSAWLAFQKRLRKPLELTFESDAFRQYPRLRAVILKSLAARSVDRYRSAAEMRKDLEDILAGKGYDDVNADEANLEMTNATLHSFAEDDVLHAPEPGATPTPTPPAEAGDADLPPPPAPLLPPVVGGAMGGLDLSPFFDICLITPAPAGCPTGLEAVFDVRADVLAALAPGPTVTVLFVDSPQANTAIVGFTVDPPATADVKFWEQGSASGSVQHASSMTSADLFGQTVLLARLDVRAATSYAFQAVAGDGLIAGTSDVGTFSTGSGVEHFDVVPSSVDAPPIKTEVALSPYIHLSAGGYALPLVPTEASSGCSASALFGSVEYCIRSALAAAPKVCPTVDVSWTLSGIDADGVLVRAYPATSGVLPDGTMTLDGVIEASGAAPSGTASVGCLASGMTYTIAIDATGDDRGILATQSITVP